MGFQCFFVSLPSAQHKLYGWANNFTQLLEIVQLQPVVPCQYNKTYIHTVCRVNYYYQLPEITFHNEHVLLQSQNLSSLESYSPNVSKIQAICTYDGPLISGMLMFTKDDTAILMSKVSWDVLITHPAFIVYLVELIGPTCFLGFSLTDIVDGN